MGFKHLQATSAMDGLGPDSLSTSCGEAWHGIQVDQSQDKSRSLLVLSDVAKYKSYSMHGQAALVIFSTSINPLLPGESKRLLLSLYFTAHNHLTQTQSTMLTCLCHL